MASPVGHAPYNKNGEGGRPKIYTDEFIEKEAIEFEKWMQQPDSLYFKEFAFLRGYSSKCFSEWEQVNQRFSETMSRVREWQEFRISKGALLNELNPSFSKFFMSNVSGWSERTESKISGDSVNPLSCLLVKIGGQSKELVDEQVED